MNEFYQKDPYFSMFMKIFRLFSLFKKRTYLSLRKLDILDLSLAAFLVLYNIYLYQRPVQIADLNRDGFYRGKNIFFIVNKLVQDGYLHKKCLEGYTHFKDLTITEKGIEIASKMERKFSKEYKKLFPKEDFAKLIECLEILEGLNEGNNGG